MTKTSQRAKSLSRGCTNGPCSGISEPKFSVQDEMSFPGSMLTSHLDSRAIAALGTCLQCQCQTIPMLRQSLACLASCGAIGCST